MTFMHRSFKMNKHQHNTSRHTAHKTTTVTCMLVQHAKKGKRFELKVAKYLAEKLDANIRRTPNSGGLSMKGDILCIDDQSILSEFNWECKNQEKLNVWDAYEQAKENCNGYEPIVVMKKNRKQPLVVIDAEHFIALCSKLGYNDK